MAEDPKQPDEPHWPPEERRLCELLDAYLAAVQSGDAAAREKLTAANPELSSWITSLDALDLLAADAVSPSRSEKETMSAAAAQTGDDIVFGHFELLAEAGRGGMGVVYKARQMDLDRIVALKMILSSRLAAADDVRRFQQEARAVARLRHPNIVAVHEVGQVHGQHYFTMDFIAGRSLAKLLEAGPIDPQRAARCLLAIAGAVDYLHSQGIVHRDLKPSNILLDERDEPFVTDFGLAKVFQADAERTQTGAILGTPSYMAPEQARGATAEISAAADVYSLGAILYEMITGLPPFREDTPLNTLLQVIEAEPTLPIRLNRRVPRELQQICLCCLEKSPASRYPSAAALARDLEHFLRREPLEIRPAGVRQRVRRWSRRQPALVAHGAAILLTAAIVQTNYFIRGAELGLHLKVMGVLGLWLALSCLFQWSMRGRRAMVGRYCWATVDVALLTALLYLTGPPLGPLVIGYPLLIAAAGLWFYVRLVSYTTALALAGYGVLLWSLPEERIAQPIHYPLIFAGALAVLGMVVAYQIHRLRVLSWSFEQRRQP